MYRRTSVDELVWSLGLEINKARLLKKAISEDVYPIISNNNLDGDEISRYLGISSEYVYKLRSQLIKANLDERRTRLPIEFSDYAKKVLDELSGIFMHRDVSNSLGTSENVSKNLLYSLEKSGHLLSFPITTGRRGSKIFSTRDFIKKDSKYFSQSYIRVRFYYKRGDSQNAIYDLLSIFDFNFESPGEKSAFKHFIQNCLPREFLQPVLEFDRLLSKLNQS